MNDKPSRSSSSTPRDDKVEGWIDDDPTVPIGWKTKTCTNRGGQTVKNMTSPCVTLLAGRKEDIGMFKSTPVTGKKFSKDYEWVEDDPTIPNGWKSTTTQMSSFGKIVESNRFT